MEKEFKIYTRTGDMGETSLIGGTRVQKNHPRIEAYGDVDELKSWIGLIRDQDIDIVHRKMLLEVQDRLFTIESHLAAEDRKATEALPKLSESNSKRLEEDIDRMNVDLTALSSFILPGGCQAASMCHIARTICRRVERRIISLSDVADVDPVIIKYINRLSDYLFVLARHVTFSAQGIETPWMPRR